MHLVSRYVVYLPDSGEDGREELVNSREAAERAGFSVLYDGAYLLAEVSGSGSSGMQSGGTPPPFLMDVFPGTACSPRMATLPADTGDLEALHRFAEQHAQCYNLLHMTAASFVLESDALGLKPVYIARVSGGSVLGSRIADLLCLFPALADPVDTVALFELLRFRAPLAERTLYQRVRRTLPGGCYRWERATGLSARRGRDIRPAPVEPLKLMDQALEEIHDATAQSLLAKTARAPQPILLALSGGFDSRLIAALCRDHHIHVRPLSYGRRQNEEWHGARAVARALALDLEMIHYREDNTLRYLAHHLDTMEGTADPSTASIMNLFEVAPAPGSSVLHGYCGGSLAGFWAGRYSAAEHSSHESLVDGVLRGHRISARSELSRLFNPAVKLDEVRQDVLAGFRTDCPPHQSYLLWELENRERRYVGSYFSLIGGHFDAIMPFYDRRLFEIWTSIPPIGLVDRTVFRRLLARYYPALAKIPHSEEPAPIIPNLRWQLARFYRGLPKRLLGRALGVERAKEVFLRSYRHDYIWNLGNLAAPQQRAHMLSRVIDLQPVLKEALGVNLAPGYESILAGDVQALRGMFLAAEYARRRADVHHGEV